MQQLTVAKRKRLVELQKVLFVLGLSCNLISVNKCLTNNCEVSFTSGKNGRGLCVAQNVQLKENCSTGIGNLDKELSEATIMTHRKTDHSATSVNHLNCRLCHAKLELGRKLTI